MTSQRRFFWARSMLLTVCGPQVFPLEDTFIYCKPLKCPTVVKFKENVVNVIIVSFTIAYSGPDSANRGHTKLTTIRQPAAGKKSQCISHCLILQTQPNPMKLSAKRQPPNARHQVSIENCSTSFKILLLSQKWISTCDAVPSKKKCMGQRKGWSLQQHYLFSTALLCSVAETRTQNIRVKSRNRTFILNLTTHLSSLPIQ